MQLADSQFYVGGLRMMLIYKLDLNYPMAVINLNSGVRGIAN